MQNELREKLIDCSLMNVFNIDQMLTILDILVAEPDLSLEDILLRRKLMASSKAAFKKMDQIKERLKKEPLITLREQTLKAGIKICTILDPDYPFELREIYQPPVVIYYQGNWTLTQGRKLGVVGSRTASEYGRLVLKKMIPELVCKEVTTISGLAKGIDQEVHIQTLKAGGKTVSVIGTGLDYFYPLENRILQEKLMREQLVLSEYPIKTGPQRYHFPLRNRIIAGLSQGTLVVEAKERSGSLITANVALQENREVFAIPGSVLESDYAGTNQLIQAGAKLVTNASDIFSEMAYLWKMSDS